MTSPMRSLASAAVSGLHSRSRASNFSAKASTMTSCPRFQFKPSALQALPHILSGTSLPSKESRRGYRHAIDEFVAWYCRSPGCPLTRPSSLPNSFGITSACTGHNQRQACCGQPSCVRSGRFGRAQPGPRCWHPPSQMAEEPQRPPRQLADHRPSKSALAGAGPQYPEGQARPSTDWAPLGLRAAPERGLRTGCRSSSTEG